MYVQSAKETQFVTVLPCAKTTPKNTVSLIIVSLSLSTT